MYYDIKVRLFEIPALNNDVVWALWMEPGGAFTTNNFFTGLHPPRPLYNARISNGYPLG